jgi:hypothetical protein
MLLFEMVLSLLAPPGPVGAVHVLFACHPPPPSPAPAACDEGPALGPVGIPFDDEAVALVLACVAGGDAAAPGASLEKPGGAALPPQPASLLSPWKDPARPPRGAKPPREGPMYPRGPVGGPDIEAGASGGDRAANPRLALGPVGGILDAAGPLGGERAGRIGDLIGRSGGDLGASRASCGRTGDLSRGVSRGVDLYELCGSGDRSCRGGDLAGGRSSRCIGDLPPGRSSRTFGWMLDLAGGVERREVVPEST